jgi:hypothetical protein
MPIENFFGDTFVAFSDIAGFKSMMKDGRRGPDALDTLYSSGYRVITEQPAGRPRVEGLFVSDCGILFVREDRDVFGRLESLLSAVEQLNRLCFERAVSLTTSVAWGMFSYHQRFEIPGIEKNPIYGNAYVAAYIDNQSDSPKMYPNECRIAKPNLPQEIAQSLGRREGRFGSRCREMDKYFYFEWMRR